MSIIIDHLSYIYDIGTPYERIALANINLVINDNEFVGIIGHTGSGKSTLIQHLNGLLKPTRGSVYYNGADIFDKDYSKKQLRREVGMVFQYPEYQLFENSVIEDVKFGPRNLGMSNLDVDICSYDALKKVGIPDSLIDASPFKLSGGEQRRVAIAGVLAMKPKVLILDEPTAGLDPKGRDTILQLIAKLRKEENITVILVSHSMEDVAKYADRLVVLNEGMVYAEGTPQKVFEQYAKLEKIGLAAPQTVYLINKLRENGIEISGNVIEPKMAACEIAKVLSY
ncbi:MAG: energy-coupling factor transporter ATPase [Lachnospiraceae bacterium]|nr:energy-coupling factor transporter ATPase [Lachnospiraceae bacterium]